MMRCCFLLLAACGSPRSEAAPAARGPSIDVAPIAELCVTKGSVSSGVVSEPTMRGYARGAGGDAAELTFTYRGETEDARALASGQLRRQLGVKLRAQDGCNVVYVMWRLDPTPKLDVSVKRNPNKRTHEECGAEGYTKVKPRKKTYVPAFEYGATHKLRAEIVGDNIFAWVDGQPMFQGRLPDSARAISGPAGVRSDNVKFDLVELAAPQMADRAKSAAPCKREGGD